MGFSKMAASLRRQIFCQGKTFVNLALKNKSITPSRTFSSSKYLCSRFYTEKHEWVLLEGGSGTVGISHHAQDQLGEIVYVELPEMDAELEEGDISGCLESVKAASEIYAPVPGTVSEVNSTLEDKPGLVNSQPLGEGWLYKLAVAADVKTDHLMDEKAYEKYVGSLEDH